MKIKVIEPVIGNPFGARMNETLMKVAAPDTEISIENLAKGPASIESRYDDMLAEHGIVERAIRAEKDGFDGIFINCFGDPGVAIAREMVKIPVVGGFQPAAMLASIVASKWSIIAVLKNVVPMLEQLALKMGIGASLCSVRAVDIPVLGLTDHHVMENRLLDQMELAILQDKARAIVLGCTGMLEVAKTLEQKLEKKGYPVPVISPIAAAIGCLETMIRCQISHSKTEYMVPPEKIRVT